MDGSTPGFPVHHQLPELAQTHVHRVGDAIQPSHPLSSPSPPAVSLAQSIMSLIMMPYWTKASNWIHPSYWTHPSPVLPLLNSHLNYIHKDPKIRSHSHRLGLEHIFWVQPPTMTLLNFSILLLLTFGLVSVLSKLYVYGTFDYMATKCDN